MAECVTADDPALVAQCDGNTPSVNSLCLQRCNATIDCAGRACVAGVCAATVTPNAHVSVDLQSQFQVLDGLGATLAYAEGEATRFADQNALASVMFSDLGLDTLRLRNRYGYSGDSDLSTAATVVSLARSSLGRTPTIILASWSPPAALKANGATTCNGEQDTCTLVRSSSGGFDYDAYADYWRDALNAYSQVGILPDYISIQNNPDYVPVGSQPGEGCKFLPTQGSRWVMANGQGRMLEFPGYDKAVKAVAKRLQELTSIPKMIAPEASVPSLVSEYVSKLDSSMFSAIGHHLYGTNPSSPELSDLRQLNEISQSMGRPVFQTEMAADGLGTAIALHHTLVTEGASSYLQNALLAPSADSGALIVVNGSSVTCSDAYHALRQFARYTEPGWVRVAAQTDQPNLLASTWVSPAGAVTVVLVNATTEPYDVEVDHDAAAHASAQVIRTSFDGVERSANLGPLPENRIVRLPMHSMVTVAFE